METQKFFNPSIIENQEHLDKLILINVKSSDRFRADTPRPSANYIDLMDWTLKTYGAALQDQFNINKFVHNRIIIDGQFLRFCQENNITVECLYKDSIISWKTDHEYEKFFVQGVFLIKSENTEFLHAALYHKGTSNDDEISFFIIVSEANFENYRNLRNKYDLWVQERDRSNLHICVVGGDDLPYSNECSWDDLFLPENMKKELKGLVEWFLVSKDFYAKNKIPWKMGFLLHGYPGCGKSLIIKTLISNYNFKPVTIVSEAGTEAVTEAFSYAEKQSPSLLYFEDLDSILDRNIEISSFLNLMDGISSKNGLLVIATANDIRRLKPSITDRPSRFDRKFEIPLPDQELAYTYLKKWFDNLINPRKCRDLAKCSEKYEFSYAYLKELYISSMFEALSNNRKAPIEKDITTSLNRLIKDKSILNNDKTINTDKYFK
jgi:SpoVK/Ycf46/Vps4 family AAA+-type ATPase